MPLFRHTNLRNEQLISDDTPYVKKQKAIDLNKLKPGATVYLNYVLVPQYENMLGRYMLLTV